MSEPSPSLLPSEQFEYSPKTDLYKVLFPLARQALNQMYYRIVEGDENIPDGPALYVSNHINAADSPLIITTVNERTGMPVRFAAKQEYFEGLGVDNEGKYGKTLKWVMEHTGQLPVDRQMKNPRELLSLGENLNAVHQRGESTGMHPEGTRSNDGLVHKFRAGVGRYALEYGFTVVPIGIHYFEKQDHRPKRPVLIRFGEPVTPDSFDEAPISLMMGKKMKADYINDLLERRVAELAGAHRSGIVADLKHRFSRPPRE